MIFASIYYHLFIRSQLALLPQQCSRCLLFRFSVFLVVLKLAEYYCKHTSKHRYINTWSFWFLFPIFFKTSCYNLYKWWRRWLRDCLSLYRVSWNLLARVTDNRFVISINWLRLLLWHATYWANVYSLHGPILLFVNGEMYKLCRQIRN